jgi:thioredoxin-dependent peroxiredoxin
MTKFMSRGVQPFGVNPAGLESHRKYVAKLKFNFPLLSDPEKEIARAYGALKPKLMGGGVWRSVYLVGKNGKILFAARGAPPADDILAPLGAGA